LNDFYRKIKIKDEEFLFVFLVEFGNEIPYIFQRSNLSLIIVNNCGTKKHILQVSFGEL
jgi:hypothetical protein